MSSTLMKYLLVALLAVAPAAASNCKRCAWSWHDPHIDGWAKPWQPYSHFQCQGEGDFVMAKDLSGSGFGAQARFYAPPPGTLHSGRNGSATAGFVVNPGNGEPRVEIELATPGHPTSGVADCTFKYYIDGEETEFTGWDVHTSDFKFTRRNSWWWAQHYWYRRFQMKSSDIDILVKPRWDSVFGCFMNVRVCAPCEFTDEREIVGLFGTPDDNVNNDFTDTDGNPIDNPPTIGEETTYCRDNWCVGDVENSLFANPDERAMCSSHHEENLDELVAAASQEVVEACEGLIDCITDTQITGDLEIGERVLEDQAEKDKDPEEIPATEEDAVEENEDMYTCSHANVTDETAFARPSDGSGCFLDDADNNFQRWGWVLEIDTSQGDSSTTFDVYAAAGQCNIGNGYKAGTVTVEYDSVKSECVGKYAAINGFTIQEFQFYCGVDKYPKAVNGHDTVAPGSYDKDGKGCVRVHTDTNSTDVCTVENVASSTGTLYAIAHVVNCETGNKNPDPEPTTRSAETPPPSTKSSASGDPHFKTFSGSKYDYHGECDLVLVDNPDFYDGLGLKLHIRTTRVKYFSFIEKAALQIGDDVLEFDNDVENFLINGNPPEADRQHHKLMLGPFQVRRDKKAVSVRLFDAGWHKHNKTKIDFHTRKNGFPAVIVDPGHIDMFKGSKGLLGEWPTGRKLMRDGTEMVLAPEEDHSAFALEWQVRDTEPMLFSEARFPQFPTKCTPPAAMPTRLGSSAMRAEAEEACAHWKEDMEDCIFDVMATRDIEVAAEGHIVHVM